MLYYVMVLSVHVSLTLSINSCTLYMNFVIQRKEKMPILPMALSCAIDGQQNIPFFDVMIYDSF